MKKSSIITLTKALLGDGFINLEVTDAQLSAYADLSIALAADYSSVVQYHTFSIPVGSFADLSILGKNVVVTNVFPKNLSLGLGDEYFFSSISINGTISIERYASIVNYRSTVDSLTGRSFRQVGNQLFVDNFTGEIVTVEYLSEYHYNPTDSDPDVALDIWAINWVVRYCVALVSHQLGRIRGKLTVNSELWSNDAESLLGSVNIPELMEELYTHGKLQVSR